MKYLLWVVVAAVMVFIAVASALAPSSIVSAEPIMPKVNIQVRVPVGGTLQAQAPTPVRKSSGSASLADLDIQTSDPAQPVIKAAGLRIWNR